MGAMMELWGSRGKSQRSSGLWRPAAKWQDGAPDAHLRREDDMRERPAFSSTTRGSLSAILVVAFAVVLLGRAVSTQERFGDFETHGDVGSPKISGSATWNAEAQEYVLTAAGSNL